MLNRSLTLPPLTNRSWRYLLGVLVAVASTVVAPHARLSLGESMLRRADAHGSEYGVPAPHDAQAVVKLSAVGPGPAPPLWLPPLAALSPHLAALIVVVPAAAPPNAPPPRPIDERAPIRRRLPRPARTDVEPLA